MTLDDFHKRLTRLKVWKRGDRRAPHKPLLLLYAMGRAVCGEERLALYRVIDRRLSGLLRHFGPPTGDYRSVYPFTRLVNDGLWEVPNAFLLSRTSSKLP